MVASRIVTALALASAVYASPCPFGQMAEDGLLSEKDEASFLAARSEGESAVVNMMNDHTKRAELDIQNEFYKRQVAEGLLPLGGGLVNGALQPFTGALKNLEVPKFIPPSLVIVPDAAHPFKVPKKTAVRGMCPTLNTMANHGFIDRSGITTFAQAANACQITLGFGYDTCTFLSGLGLYAGGDLATGKMTIGGMDSRVPNTLGPALGNSHHGPFEVDQSISRQDTYFGNNANFQLKMFNDIVKMADKNHGGQFSQTLWNEERQATYIKSRDTNPQFDAGPKHLAVTLAERVFIFRALPNGTTLNNANKANVLPFYLNETFPPRWFKRGVSYGLDEVGTDVADLFLLGPTELGYNQGLGNFIPLQPDTGALTPENAKCFLLINLLDLVPGQFSTAVDKYFSLYNAFVQGAMIPFFATKAGKANDCSFIYTKPGGTVGVTKGGVSTGKNYLVNGKYRDGA